jgi:hypothetical protein
MTEGNQKKKLSRHHLWCLLVIGLLGLLSYFSKCDSVFPSASIDLKLSRRLITEKAEAWAQQLSYPPEAAVKSTTFSYDETAKTFLEYELGLTEANVLMKEQIPVWRWTTRFCRPLRLEDCSIYLSPDGKLVACDHAIENDKELPTVNHKEALALAQSFVESQAKLSLASYKQIEDGSISQPRRTDHFFTWQENLKQFKGAKLRIYVYVAGNQVTIFNHYLHVPQSWTRKFSKLRSYNQALGDIASIFYAALNVATFFAFLWAFTSGLLRWRLALFVSLFMALVTLGESINSLPQAIQSYTTTMSFNGYLMDTYVSAFSSAINEFMQMFLLVGSSEALYRVFWPKALALEHLFSIRGLATRQVLDGCLAGYGLFGTHLGFIVFYYLFGRQVGLWAPLEIHNVDTLSASLPFFSAMYVGISAAVSEELTYRVLGMSIAQKLVGNFWLANLIQAAAWAFMHSNYAQEPPYARGLELTIVGLFYGFILRRFGLIACIISHYVFDCFLGVAPLLFSPVWSLKVTGLATISPFIVVGIFSYIAIRRGRNEIAANETALANETVKADPSFAHVEDVLPKSAYVYAPLSKRKRIALILIGTIACLIQFCYYFPCIGQKVNLNCTRDQAIEIARRYLIANDIKPEGHYEVAYLTRGWNAQAIQYAYEKVRFKRTEELAEAVAHPLIWRVRFFRILDPTEYIVILDPKGRPLSLACSLAEDAEGGNLSKDSALKAVSNYLEREHAEVEPTTLKDASEARRSRRTDWSFTFESPKYDIADAPFKVVCGTVGNLVSGYDDDWQIPDKWLFDRAKRTSKDQFASYLMIALNVVFSAAVIWWIRGLARTGTIRWRPAIFLALIMALLLIPEALNTWPQLFTSYSTDSPLSSYLIGQGVKQVMAAVSFAAMLAGLAAFAQATFRLLFPHTSVVSILEAALGIGQEPDTKDSATVKRDFWLDAVLAGYAAGIGWRALIILSSAIHAQVSPVVTMSPLESFCRIVNVYNPAFDTLLDSLTWGMYFLLVAGVTVGIYAKYSRNFGYYVAFCLMISLLYPLSDRYLQDYVTDATSYFVFLLAAWLFIYKFARTNLLAYLVAGAAYAIALPMRILLQHGFPLFAEDITILALVLASPAIYVGYLFISASMKAPDLSSPAK